MAYKPLCQEKSWLKSHIYGDNVYVSFWKRVKEVIKKENTTQEWVAQKVGVTGDTFRRWMSKPIMPNADQVYIISRELNTTVEYLIDGTNGEKYIIDWAGQHGARWKPPPRLKPLLDVVENLPDTKLIELIEIAKVFAKSEKLEAEPRSEAG